MVSCQFHGLNSDRIILQRIQGRYPWSFSTGEMWSGLSGETLTASNPRRVGLGQKNKMRSQPSKERFSRGFVPIVFPKSTMDTTGFSEIVRDPLFY